MKLFIGIDPGKQGGIAAVKEDGTCLFKCVMPLEIDGQTIDGVYIFNKFEEWKKKYKAQNIIIYLEKVGSMGKGSGRSMFTFGEGYGIIKGVIQCAQLPYVLVTPQTWNKKMWTGTDTKLDTKNRSRMAASRLFPTESFLMTDRSKVAHDGVVEARLIAEYGRLNYG